MYIKNSLLFLILFLIATEGLFANYKIAGIGMVRIVEALYFFYIIKSFFNDLRENKILLITFKLSIIFFLLLSLKLFTVTFIFNHYESKIFIDFARLTLMFMLFYIMYYILSKDIKYLNIILLLNLPIIIIAFFQGSFTPFTDLAWYLKFHYFAQLGNDIDTPWFRTRVCGLYPFTIPLGYILVTNMIVALYLYIKFSYIRYIYYFIFLGIVSSFTLTRSVMLSWLVITLYFLYLILRNGTMIKKIIVFFSLFLFISFSLATVATNADKFSRLSQLDDNSAEGRIPLAITATYSLIKYPLGFSDIEYNIAKKEMYNIIHNKNILEHAGHNGFLNIGFVYTLIGLFVFIGYFIYIFMLVKNKFSYDIKSFLMVIAIAYLANSLFHNNFLFYSDFYGLLILAILAVEYKLAKERKYWNVPYKLDKL